MGNISRAEFLKMGAVGLAATLAAPSLFGRSNNTDQTNNPTDEKLLKRLVEGNDKSVDRYLDFAHEHILTDEPPQIQSGRPLSRGFALLTASYCHQSSKYYKSKMLLENLEKIIDELLELQYPNGTLDSGGNRQSPPDTAFVVEMLCPAAEVLKKQNFPETSGVTSKLKKFLLSAGEGLVKGGVHTPNHRWEVSATLARLYSLFPDEKYLNRIEDWLGEGIYINEDGQFPERSRNYAIVVDDSLITLGRILKRPALFDIVKKNLTATYYYMENNGELITLDSRRQDQNYLLQISSYYLFYRYLAIYYKDEFFTSIVNKIETFEDFEKNILSRSLIHFMEEPSLLNELKNSNELPTHYSKLFAQSGLARIRRGDITASVFGGNDKPLIVSSGRSCNPDFFTFRKGAASLDYIRLSTSFFSMGYFRSDGVIKEGNKYTLHEVKEAYYYQPMPKSKRKPDGNYAMTESVDGRFWSKMAFDERPKDTLTLDTTVAIVEEEGIFNMTFEIKGEKADKTEVTLDFCFDEDGNLEGVTSGKEEGDYFLENGSAKYTSGKDVIEIGPGKVEHRNVKNLDGEVYSTHFGTIKGKGKHVYITGYVPFKYSLTVR